MRKQILPLSLCCDAKVLISIALPFLFFCFSCNDNQVKSAHLEKPSAIFEQYPTKIEANPEPSILSLSSIPKDSTPIAKMISHNRKPVVHDLVENNTIHLSPSRKIRVEKDLEKLIPNKNGLPMPRTFRLEGIKKTIIHTPPIKVSSPGKKETAYRDIQYIDIDQGLKTPNFNTTYQDKKGNLWFGSYDDGLFIYNGVTMVHWSKQNGLAGNEIEEIIVDNENNLWIATHDGGISVYNGIDFTEFSLKNGFSNKITDLEIDHTGNIWMATWGDGVYKYDGQYFTHYPPVFFNGDGGISSMAEDEEGNIWFGTWAGYLIQYDGEGFTNFSPKGNFNGATISSIYIDKEEIWLGTYDNGFFRFEGPNFTHYPIDAQFNFQEIRSIIKDRQGNIWLSSNKGVYQIKETEIIHYSKKNGLSNNKIKHIFEDDQGVIWVSTDGGGVNKIKKNNFEHFTNFGAVRLDEISVILEDGNQNKWIGTLHNGLIKFKDNKWTNYTTETGLISNVIDDLGLMDTNLLISSYDSGPTIFNEQNSINLQSDFLKISYGYQINSGKAANSYWFSTRTYGLFYIEGKTSPIFQKVINTDGSKTKYIKHIYRDSKEKIWFCHVGGLTYMDSSNHFISNNIGELDVFPITLFEDSLQNLWIGTENNGIVRYDGENFYQYTEKNGLSSNKVKAINTDANHNIWVATNNGLNLLTPEFESSTSPNYKIRVFGKQDGLMAEQFNENAAMIDATQTIWWGHSKGLTKLDLSTFVLNDNPPNLHINQIQINQKLIDFQRLTDEQYAQTIPFAEQLTSAFDSIVPFYNYPEKLTLPHRLNHLTFNFTAIDWLAPHQLQYSTFLEGIDEQWSAPSRETKIDFRNISPGSYTFHVKAIGAADKWSELKSYQFTILPPWWLSKWAYFGYILMALGILRLTYGIARRRQLLKNQLILNQQETTRLKELDQFKSQLYTNLTHEFRTPLTVMLGMAQQIKSKGKKETQKAAQLIENNGKNLLRLINQLLDLSKLENKSFKLALQQSDIVPYLRYLVESFHTFANSHNLSLQFFTNFHQLEMDYDAEQIKQILTNLISNAIKFTPSGGSIEVILNKVNNQLQIEVKDSGIGIAEKELAHIFDRFYQVDSSITRKGEGTGIGLAHTQELVKVMGGTIVVNSQLNKGTTFLISLPIHNQARLTETPSFEKTATPPSIITSVKTHEYKATVAANQPQLLLIEDNPDVVIYLKTCLEGLYQIDVAYNGKIGVEKAIESTPDIIISDVMMPEKDGYQVCDELKKDERTSHIPIILLTAKADIDSKIFGLKTGADAYLAKPFDKEELLVRLDNMLALRRKLQAYFAQVSDTLNTNLGARKVSATYAAENSFLQKVRTIIEKELTNAEFNPIRLSRALGMSQSQMYRKIKAITNTTPALFIRKIRLQKGSILLKTTNLTVSEIAYEVGFTDPAYFSRTFSEEFGSPPNENRK